MGRTNNSNLTVAEQIAELREIRKMLQAERSNLAAKNRSLAAENSQLKVEKRSLLNYIKELEIFLPHKRDEHDQDEKIWI